MKKTYGTAVALAFIASVILAPVFSEAYAESNLSRGKRVTQSSTGYGGNPERAVDGNTDGNYFSNTVSHTNNAPQEWWQVDLGSAYEVGRIRIWNRTDCCSERLSKFYVLVSDQPFTSGNLQDTLRQPGVWNTYYDGQGGRPTEITVNRPGRYVRIQLAGANWLSLAEVEVLGSELRQAAATGGGNLALRKRATQSSTGYGGNPERAVDGNTDGNYSANSVSHTNNRPHEWWQVDLGSVEQIGSARIWNRTDCCRERLIKFYVLVSDVPFYSEDLSLVLNMPGIQKYYHEGIGGRPSEIPINRTGRFVRIQLAETDYLSLAEVEIFGPQAQRRDYTSQRRQEPQQRRDFTAQKRDYTAERRRNSNPGAAESIDRLKGLFGR